MKSIAAVLATLALTGPALAGGPVEVAPEPTITPVYDAPAASADWSGFYAGVQLGYADVDSNGGGLDGNGTLGGVHAGYRWDFGQYVAGAELDYDTANIDLGPVAGDTLDDVMRLKLMGGAEFGNSLIYATTGIARASATVGGADLSDNGYFLGAGIDYAIGERWTVGGELLQHRFTEFGGTTVDLDATTIKAKVALRF